jgi:hypothetical protein
VSPRDPTTLVEVFRRDEGGWASMSRGLTLAQQETATAEQLVADAMHPRTKREERLGVELALLRRGEVAPETSRAPLAE